MSEQEKVQGASDERHMTHSSNISESYTVFYIPNISGNNCKQGRANLHSIAFFRSHEQYFQSNNILETHKV